MVRDAYPTACFRVFRAFRGLLAFLRLIIPLPIAPDSMTRRSRPAAPVPFR